MRTLYFSRCTANGSSLFILEKKGGKTICSNYDEMNNFGAEAQDCKHSSTSTPLVHNNYCTRGNVFWFWSSVHKQIKQRLWRENFQSSENFPLNHLIWVGVFALKCKACWDTLYEALKDPSRGICCHYFDVILVLMRKCLFSFQTQKTNVFLLLNLPWTSQSFSVCTAQMVSGSLHSTICKQTKKPGMYSLRLAMDNIYLLRTKQEKNEWGGS